MFNVGIMKWKKANKFHTVGTVQIFLERDRVDTHSTHIHDESSLYWLDTGT